MLLSFEVTFLFSCKTCKKLLDNLHRTPAKENLLPISYCMSVCLKVNVTLYGAFQVRLNYHNAFWKGLALSIQRQESSGSDSLLLDIGADLEELAPKNERISIL